LASGLIAVDEKDNNTISVAPLPLN